MQTKYHAAFKLGIKGKKYANFDVLKKYLKDYIPIEEKDNFEEGMKIVTENYSLETIAINNEYFGVSFTNRDIYDLNINRNLKIGITNKFPEKEIDIKLSEESINRIICPSIKLITRPNLVYYLLSEFGGYDADLPLISRNINVNFDNLEHCCSFIMSDKRIYPVVFISKTFFDDSYLLDPNKTAKELAGLGYVFAQQEDVTRNMELILGQGNSCYDGAVRIYWPNYKNTFNSHWRKDVLLQTVAFEKNLLKIIAQSSVLTKGHTNFDEIKYIQSKLNIQTYMNKFEEAKNSQESKEFVSNLLSEYDIALKQNENLNFQIECLNEELSTLNKKNSQLQYIIQNMNKSKTIEEKEEEIPELQIKTVKEAVDKYLELYPESNVIINPKVEKMIKKSSFENPKLIFDALEWLNEVYIPSRVDGGIDLISKCYEDIKMEYNANQPVFMKRYEDYNITHNGKVIFMEEHLKKGTSYDPKTTLRICFYYDIYNKKVIVGYIGKHPKTDAS